MSQRNQQNEEKSSYYLKVREAFDQIRQQKREGFSLKWRLFIVVATGLFIGIWAGYGISELLRAWGVEFTDVDLIFEVSLVSMVVALGFSLLVSKWIFKPIKELRDAMDKVADGDFDVRLADHSHSKEIGEVYTGFNLMAHELGTTEMLQRDFTSNVSHEFKTPIAAIEGYSTLLQGGDNLTEDQQQYVEKILYNTDRLGSLVGNILLLSKLENQTIETNQKLYLLDEQIRESLLGLEPMWIEKNVEFDVELDSIKYYGNEGLMRHVWDNLISNAIKFSPEGGIVKLILIKDGGIITFTVEDCGPGIPDDAKKRIFDKFYQHDNSREQKGHGLGLPLARRIILLCGGRIEVSDREGGGSVFTVSLKE